MQKPVKGNQLQRGHPLAKGIILASLINTGFGGKIYDLSGSNHHGTIAGAIWDSLNDGTALFHDSTGDIVSFGASNLILPTQEITIALGYKKTDGSNRGSGAFGLESSAAGEEKCGVHLPYSNGTVYWDFGGTGENSTRESVGGLTFGDDNWVFTTGPNGMEIWQNGILRTSNSSNPIRTATSKIFSFGTHGGVTSDLAKYRYFYIYNRQLQEAEIVRLNSNPYQMFEVNLKPEIFGSIAAAAAVGNPWYYYAQM